MLVHQLLHHGGEDNIFFHGASNVTYKQLQVKVANYRDYLYQTGVRPGDNVGLLMRNSPAFVYAYMAIVSLSAVVVPINYQLTSREVAYIVQDAQIKNLIVESEVDLVAALTHYGYLNNVIQHFIARIDTYSMPQGSAPLTFDGKISENQPCTIIYTSGTTGNPKGAVLTHKNLVSDAVSYSKAIPVHEDDNVLCILPLYHCFAWTCIILCSLLRGASITIMDTIVPNEVIKTIKRFGVTVIYGVPSVYMLLLKTAETHDFAGIRLVISGGASLPRQVAKDFNHKFGVSITEGYGLSEAAPVVSVNPQYREKHLSVGLPLPGIEIKIVNRQGSKLKPGAVGELTVRGPNVMKEYFNLPTETAQALRSGWLHTGDLAFQDEDGYLFIVDRLKDMIITNGENIYPREIEEVLYSYPGVCEAAVIGISNGIRGEVAHAYVVMKDGRVLDKKAIRNYLRGKLASYKIPQDFIQIDSLPKNQSGKIMKRLLLK